MDSIQNHLDLCAVSQDWLHNFDLHLNTVHKDFNVLTFRPSPEEEEEPTICAPRYSRGRGGVAIFWRKSLDHLIQMLHQRCNDRVITLKLISKPSPTCFISAYLPTRSGGPDVFKASLDYTDTCLQCLSYDSDVILLGDLNADLGHLGGPLCMAPSNKQGRFLA